MTTRTIFLWAAIGLVLITLSIEPRVAQTWAALFGSVSLLLFLGRFLPARGTRRQTDLSSRKARLHGHDSSVAGNGALQPLDQ